MTPEEIKKMKVAIGIALWLSLVCTGVLLAHVIHDAMMFADIEAWKVAH